MNEFIEKLIERFEEVGNILFASYTQPLISVKDAIKIIHQTAEEYEQKEYCWQSCACTEKCKDCIRLGNGNIDWYENIEDWTEEYKQDWIPCSDRLPENLEEVLVWYEYFRYGDYNQMYQTYGIGYHVNGMWCGDVSGTKARCIAWQPLPAPYQSKEKCNKKLNTCADCEDAPCELTPKVQPKGE